MKHRLDSIAILPASKMAAVIYAVIGLCFVPIGCVVLALDPQDPAALMIAALYLFFPLIYLIAGFIGAAITTWIYNLAAKHIGGLEFEFEPIDPSQSEALAEGD